MWNRLRIANFFWTQIDSDYKDFYYFEKYLWISARICVLYLLNIGR